PDEKPEPMKRQPTTSKPAALPRLFKTRLITKGATSMKRKSASQSAFFNPRVLIGFILCSISVLLAVAALSKSVASSLGVTQSAVREHGTARAPDQSKSNADWPQYGFDPEHTSFIRE